ncbi:acetyl-CoA:L-glutamate N-acetyltransferase [Aspergillus chevalieri]|uniref:Amino-acid acetyltransferase, mitochondrial n=1 Tax=Aspergillus chevalieri TaxID=182096 RepID=A0A7R7VP42_ASPCH|nr:amino-acid acetyltransferase, mitochondrial [Aspergillus chevalieri]BCR88102.1 amino-acid acetyltransferase, mitochondrial [Aspergillus chevalieri]
MSTSTLKWPRSAPSSLLQQNSRFIKRDHLPRPWCWSFSSSADRPVHQSADFSSYSKNSDRLGRRAKEKLLDREFFLSLLSSASTKREAKSYLARIKQQPKTDYNPPTTLKAEPELSKATVSAAALTPQSTSGGSFYGASRSVYDSPVFRQHATPAAQPQDIVEEKLHLALVKITTPQLLETSIIDGVAKTLAQLSRLGLPCCVVVDPGTKDDPNVLRKIAIEQADRISSAIDAQPDSKSVRLDSVFSITSTATEPTVFSRKVLLNPLRDAHTVIVPPIGYTMDTPRAVFIPANDAVLALTKELAGLAYPHDPDEDPLVTANRIRSLQKEVSLDRVILLDPLGGIPAYSGPQTSHVFINMEQEVEDIEDELLRVGQSLLAPGAAQTQEGATSIADSNPLTDFVNLEVASTPYGQAYQINQAKPGLEAIDGHIENLRLSQKALSMLPATSSGIISSPTDVANSARTPQTAASDVSNVGTRRQRNPLIHNLLTDKPLLSSSLPMSRRSALDGNKTLNPPVSHTTFVKRGMPLTLMPDPRVQMWTSNKEGRVRLTDPCIDLPRLVHLIEDSFNRKLDVQDYLKRVNERLAGVIIAGEYEGGAILTWETPPGVSDDDSEASRARMVPYLDKFAVLKRSQGAGGVADMVFNAMVRTCFPNGVCWRSRKDNPVNKWYFERSRGTWKLADTNWTMFWTTPGLPDDAQKLQDYEAVCRTIEPSWADNTGVID